MAQKTNSTMPENGNGGSNARRVRAFVPGNRRRPFRRAVEYFARLARRAGARLARKKQPMFIVNGRPRIGPVMSPWEAASMAEPRFPIPSNRDLDAARNGGKFPFPVWTHTMPYYHVTAKPVGENANALKVADFPRPNGFIEVGEDGLPMSLAQVMSPDTISEYMAARSRVPYQVPHDPASESGSPASGDDDTTRYFSRRDAGYGCEREAGAENPSGGASGKDKKPE